MRKSTSAKRRDLLNEKSTRSMNAEIDTTRDVLVRHYPYERSV